MGGLHGWLTAAAAARGGSRGRGAAAAAAAGRVAGGGGEPAAAASAALLRLLRCFKSIPATSAGKEPLAVESPARVAKVMAGPAAEAAAVGGDWQTPPVPAGFTVLREGEGDILQHGNDVFYNKAQVVNRDMSIAFLRTFVQVWQEEQALRRANQKKRRRGPLGQADAGIGAEQGSQTAEMDTASQDAPDPAGVNGLHEAAAKEMIASSDVMVEEAAKDTPSARPNAGAEAGRVRPEEFGNDEPPAPSGAEPMQGKPLRVLEALAASGLRAIRYAKEVGGLGAVVALDNDRVAVEACERNVRFNGPAAAAVQPFQADARVYMLTHEKEFDVVDLDPYGSPSIFLDSAVQAVSDGGMLLCTATDMAVLCGHNAEVGYSKYGAYPLRAKCCHEQALRILLAAIESAANRYKRHIVPVVSLSVDFYVRVFVRIYTSAAAVKASPSKLAYLFQCSGCESFHLQPVGRIVNKNNSVRYVPGSAPTIGPTCNDCGKGFQMGGPIWADPIHDPAWVASTLASIRHKPKSYPAYEKIHSILTAVSEELVDVPLYLSLHSLSSTLKCTPPSALLFRSALANAGFRTSSSHASPLGLKTDAPMNLVWDVMRCWVKTHAVKQQPADTPGAAILARVPEHQANFTRASSALSVAQSTRVPRFLPNPEQYWGPKPRAHRKLTGKHRQGYPTPAINGGTATGQLGQLQHELNPEAEGEPQVEAEAGSDAKRAKAQSG